jgi:membrane-associated phospholipid phosphatase
MPPSADTILTADRRAGAALRSATARVPGGVTGARWSAEVLGPGFRAVVVALLAQRAGRRAGAEAIASALLAAGVARALRDRLGRPRRGSRTEGGLPSRHAAAAVAIARAVGHHRPRLGAALMAAAIVGLTGRVAARHHDPADIAAGALVGVGAHAVVRALSQGRRRECG